MSYTVKDVAELSGVSIRTLHHYDNIGLLAPAGKSEAGYRQYSDEDLEKLQQILFFRELDFALAEIASIIENPDFDRRQALIGHKTALVRKKERLEAMIRSCDQTIKAIERGKNMQKKEMFDGFDETKIEEYRKEAREKYGKKEVDECEARTSKYTKGDWSEVNALANDIYEKIAGFMRKKISPSAAEVQKQVARHFSMINEKFYTCAPEVYRGLGDLYVDDDRFASFYDKFENGLAKYMREAMHAYCDALPEKN
ncbi:MAG TPA: MerR family transcriptional regulator [Candidatus Wallbacteria bacterium]|nr:MerR family transcriptional regulator [Candidatus Wallbacteria bacterium]